MKIGIITLLSENYGAVLQAFALQTKLENLGCETEIINYNDKYRITSELSIVRKILFYTWKTASFFLTQNKKHSRFKNFRKDYLNLTARRYITKKELADNCPSYDIYMSGSDQIWNPALFLYDTSYFFDFVHDVKKISYASSFGKNDFEKKWAKKCGEFLKDYTHISVRETSGVKIVKELTDKVAEVNIDPTLLLSENEWLDMFGLKEGWHSPFILCYIMPGDRLVTESIEIIAKELSQKTGLPIIRLGNKEFDIFKYGKGCDIKAGPLEFLQYFVDAKYVVTNSFHGTAFSLNFEKEIYVPINANMKSALHERVLSIADLLHANEILVAVKTINDARGKLREGSLDYTNIQSKLDEQREKTDIYLRKALCL